MQVFWYTTFSQVFNIYSFYCLHDSLQVTFKGLTIGSAQFESSHEKMQRR